MVLLPSPLPLAPSRAAASPLSSHPRPRRHPLPGARCSARRTPPPPSAAVGGREADSWAGKLAGAVTWKAAVSGALALTLSFSCFVGLVNAKAGVNKPELLPREFTTVIDVAGFLSSGQENRLRQEIEDLEKDTGYKLRVLAQNYPDTPGLAIKDFWQVDDQTIVFVADPTFGNIINFNIGSLVDLNIPQSFWSRVSGKYGNMFYWKEKGEDASIEAAVMAISRCLREPTGATNCSEVFEMEGEGVSLEELEEYHMMVSKTFRSEKEGYECYNAYAKEKGFSVRMSDVKRFEDTNLPYRRLFVCFKQGFRSKKNFERPNPKRTPRALSCCRCQARLEIELSKDSGEWFVKKFVDRHNHRLAKPDESAFLYSHRRLSDAEKADAIEYGIGGLRTHQIMEVMEK